MDSRPNLDESTMAPKSSTAKDPDIHKVERLQVPYSTNAPAFGSDVVAETLSQLDIPPNSRIATTKARQTFIILRIVARSSPAFYGFVT